MTRQHNIYIRATALSSVRGRVDYISSPDRQEHLEAVFNTRDDEFWKALAIHCKKAAAEAGHKKPCEAREFMVALDNSLYSLDPHFLAEKLSARVKQKTGLENVVAIHWNKKKNNYHAHIIISENQEINEVSYGAVLQKNTYFDAKGKRSTKSKCVDPETKELLPGCELVLKGGRKETVKRFGTKCEMIGSKMFLHSLKEDLATLQNELLETDKYKVFRHDGIHIPQQHIGNRIRDEKIIEAMKAKNSLVRGFNSTADEILDIPKKNDSEATGVVQEQLKSYRNMMKTYGGTDKWIYALQFCLEMMRKFLNSLIEKRKELTKTKSEEERKSALYGKMTEAEQNRAPNVKTRHEFVKNNSCEVERE